MSIVSSWLNNEPERDAINRQTTIANDQADWYKNLFDTTNQGINDAIPQAKQNATDLYGEQTDTLNAFFQSQEGPIQNMLNEIRDTGRNQAARSGLIGGGQESAFITPQINNLQQNVSSQQAGLQSNMMNKYSDTLNNLDQTQIQSLQQLLSGALGGLGGAQRNQFDAAGKSVEGPMDNIMALAGLVLDGISATKQSKK